MPPQERVELRCLSFEAVAAWDDNNICRMWPVWQATARSIVAGADPLRAAQPPDPAVRRLLEQVAALPDHAPTGDVRRFIEGACRLCEVDVPGFLTGYFEPVVAGSLVRTDAFTAPVLPRPADLVTFAPGTAGSGLPDGSLVPYPDRASLEAFALSSEAQPIVWLRDWIEVFIVHVQGSARVRLPGGDERRLVYAGRNGHPYTSIGRFLAEAGEISWSDMSLDRLKGWVRTHGQAAGEAGRDLMQRNRSYIFFNMTAADANGPTGGAGLPLTDGVSIAVDRSIWPYGLPFVITADSAVPGFGPGALNRLFVAQDTGSAIVGAARIDLFLGSGDAAGAAAGQIRHPARIAVLLPNPS